MNGKRCFNCGLVLVDHYEYYRHLGTKACEAGRRALSEGMREGTSNTPPTPAAQKPKPGPR